MVLLNVCVICQCLLAELAGQEKPAKIKQSVLPSEVKHHML